MSSFSLCFVLQLSQTYLQILTGKEDSGEEADDAARDEPRRFTAQRLTMLGGVKTTEFSLDEVCTPRVQLSSAAYVIQLV